MEKKYIVKKTLKEDYGFTEAMIKNLIPTPDKIVPNPHYKKAGDMQLYDEERIKEIIKSPLYIEWRKKLDQHTTKRKAGAKKAVETKTQKTLENARKTLEWDFPNVSTEKLKEMAVRHYNNLWWGRGEIEKIASVSDDSDFLYRITENMLRHEYSNYEYILYTLSGQIGQNKAREFLQKELKQAIFNKYLWE